MLSNYPFFFTPEKPARLSEAPEHYQNKGKRLDGADTKNDHSKVAGKSFPMSKSTVYSELMESGAKRDNDVNEQQKI